MFFEVNEHDNITFRISSDVQLISAITEHLKSFLREGFIANPNNILFAVRELLLWSIRMNAEEGKSDLLLQCSITLLPGPTCKISVTNQNEKCEYDAFVKESKDSLRDNRGGVSLLLQEYEKMIVHKKKNKITAFVNY